VQVLVAINSDATNKKPIEEFARAEGIEVELEDVSDRILARFTGDDTPDVLLMDFRFPGFAGLDGIQKMLSFLDGKPLAILVDHAVSGESESFFAAGANGVLPMDMTPDAFAAAVLLLREGITFAVIEHRHLSERMKKVATLSEREVQILSGICHGLQNKEIAHAFDIKEVTVKMHVRSIIRKLGARNRTHAAMLARDLSIA